MRARTVLLVLGLPVLVAVGAICFALVLSHFANSVTGTGAVVLTLLLTVCTWAVIAAVVRRGRRRRSPQPATRPPDSAGVAGGILGVASALWLLMLVAGAIQHDRGLMLFGGLGMVMMLAAFARLRAASRMSTTVAPQQAPAAEGLRLVSDPRAVILLATVVVALVVALVVWLVLNPGNPLLPAPR